MIGLLGFWNHKKRKIILDMIKKELPKDWILEKISWLSAENVYDDVYLIYTQITHKTEGYNIKYDYWSHRTNGFGRYDIKNKKCNPCWNGMRKWKK